MRNEERTYVLLDGRSYSLQTTEDPIINRMLMVVRVAALIMVLTILGMIAVVVGDNGPVPLPFTADVLLWTFEHCMYISLFVMCLGLGTLICGPVVCSRAYRVARFLVGLTAFPMILAIPAGMTLVGSATRWVVLYLILDFGSCCVYYSRNRSQVAREEEEWIEIGGDDEMHEDGLSREKEHMVKKTL